MVGGLWRVVVVMLVGGGCDVGGRWVVVVMLVVGGTW